MLKQLADLKKEVAALEADDLTPEQQVQIKQLMETYYQTMLAKWAVLNKKGLARGALQGGGPWHVNLPTLELKQYLYLEKELLAPEYRRGEKPKLQPSELMQEEARLASLKLLTKKHPQYLNRAKVQRNKKRKQIKTLEKKIRAQIRSLQKDPEVQQVLKKVGGKLDTTFLSQE